MALSYPSISILDVVSYINSKQVATGLQNFQFGEFECEVLKWAKMVSEGSLSALELQTMFKQGKLYDTNRFWHGLANNGNSWATSTNDWDFSTVPNTVFQANPINTSTAITQKGVIAKNQILQLADANGNNAQLAEIAFANTYYMMWRGLLEKYDAYLRTQLPTLISANGGADTQILPTTSGNYRVIPIALRDRYYEAMKRSSLANFKNNAKQALLFSGDITFNDDTVYKVSNGGGTALDKDQFTRAFANRTYSERLQPILGDYAVAYMAEIGSLGVFEFTHDMDMGEMFELPTRKFALVETPSFMVGCPKIQAMLMLKTNDVNNIAVNTNIIEFGQDTVLEMGLIFYPTIIQAATQNPERRGVLGFTFTN